MKFLSHLIGLLMVQLIAVSIVKADISLKLKNRRYLPPAQNSQLSVKGKLQQYENNNQYGAANKGVEIKNNNRQNAASGAKKLRFQHINAPPGFAVNNPDLGASLLNVASKGRSNKIIVKHEHVRVGEQSNVRKAPVFANYQHDFPGQPTSSTDSYGRQNTQKTYLPPVNNRYGQPQKNAQQLSDGRFQLNDDYLPPQLPTPLPLQSASGHRNSAGSSSNNVDDNISKYLPPQQNSAGQDINSDKIQNQPNYLPPPQSDLEQEQRYLPPSNANSAVRQQGPPEANNPLRTTSAQQLSQPQRHHNHGAVTARDPVNNPYGKLASQQNSQRQSQGNEAGGPQNLGIGGPAHQQQSLQQIPRNNGLVSVLKLANNGLAAQQQSQPQIRLNDAGVRTVDLGNIPIGIVVGQKQSQPPLLVTNSGVTALDLANNLYGSAIAQQQSQPQLLVNNAGVPSLDHANNHYGHAAVQSEPHILVNNAGIKALNLANNLYRNAVAQKQLHDQLLANNAAVPALDIANIRYGVPVSLSQPQFRYGVSVGQSQPQLLVNNAGVVPLNLANNVYGSAVAQKQSQPHFLVNNPGVAALDLANNLYRNAAAPQQLQGQLILNNNGVGTLDLGNNVVGNAVVPKQSQPQFLVNNEGVGNLDLPINIYRGPAAQQQSQPQQPVNNAGVSSLDLANNLYEGPAAQQLSQPQQPVNNAGVSALDLANNLYGGPAAQQQAQPQQLVNNAGVAAPDLGNNLNRNPAAQQHAQPQLRANNAGVGELDLANSLYRSESGQQQSQPQSLHNNAGVTENDLANNNYESAAAQQQSQPPPVHVNDPGVKVPGYLPPGYDFNIPASAEKSIAELHKLPEDATNAEKPQSQNHKTTVTVHSSIQVAGNGPSGNVIYGSPKPGNGPQAPEILTDVNGSTNDFKAAKYSEIAGQQIQSLNSGREVGTFSTPAYLPPGQDFQKPEDNQQLQQQSNYNDGSGQQLNSYGQNNPLQSADIGQQIGQSPFNGASYLPPSTESTFDDIDALFAPVPNLSNQQSDGTASQPSAQFSVFLPAPKQGPSYLPPVQSAVAASSSNSDMYSLMSYMQSVQPNERYGTTRKPLSKYGPPPATDAPYNPHSNEVAPMYKEASSIPQYYAPGMSYATNAVGSSRQSSRGTLSQQARETLQTFMPQEIRQQGTLQNNAADGHTGSHKASASAKTSSKVRTVQIVNPNEVKTLKVLESLDHTGLKTIEILGASNEPAPEGQHREISVVSGQQQQVQTVKIFNDQEDYAPTNVASKNGFVPVAGNSYLPPRRKRNPITSSGKGPESRESQ